MLNLAYSVYSCALLHSYLGLFLDSPHLFDLYCIGEYFTQIRNLIKLYFVTILFYRKPKTTTEYNAKHNAEEGGGLRQVKMTMCLQITEMQQISKFRCVREFHIMDTVSLKRTNNTLSKGTGKVRYRLR